MKITLFIIYWDKTIILTVLDSRKCLPYFVILIKSVFYHSSNKSNHLKKKLNLCPIVPKFPLYIYLKLYYNQSRSEAGTTGSDPRLRRGLRDRNLFSEKLFVCKKGTVYTLRIKIHVLFKHPENIKIHFTIRTSVACYFSFVSVFLEDDFEIFG